MKNEIIKKLCRQLQEPVTVGVLAVHRKSCVLTRIAHLSPLVSDSIAKSYHGILVGKPVIRFDSKHLSGRLRSFGRSSRFSFSGRCLCRCLRSYRQACRFCSRYFFLTFCLFAVLVFTAAKKQHCSEQRCYYCSLHFFLPLYSYCEALV